MATIYMSIHIFVVTEEKQKKKYTKHTYIISATITYVAISLPFCSSFSRSLVLFFISNKFQLINMVALKVFRIKFCATEKPPSTYTHTHTNGRIFPIKNKTKQQDEVS